MSPRNEGIYSIHQKFLTGQKLSSDLVQKMEALEECKDRRLDIYDLQKILENELYDLGEWGMYHLYCLTPDGKAVDIEGVREEGDFIKEWKEKDQTIEYRFSARQVFPAKDKYYVELSDIAEDEQEDVLARAKTIIQSMPEFFGLPTKNNQRNRKK